MTAIKDLTDGEKINLIIQVHETLRHVPWWDLDDEQKDEAMDNLLSDIFNGTGNVEDYLFIEED